MDGEQRFVAFVKPYISLRPSPRLWPKVTECLCWKVVWFHPVFSFFLDGTPNWLVSELEHWSWLSLTSSEKLHRRSIDESTRLCYPKNTVWECTRCAKCCRDSPSHDRQILLLQSEANEISQASGLKITDFSESSASGTYILRMKKKAGRCVFLDGVQCRIYEKRPLVCQFYPIWLRQDNATYMFGITNECPGVGKGRSFERSHYVFLLGLAQQRLNV